MRVGKAALVAAALVSAPAFAATASAATPTPIEFSAGFTDGTISGITAGPDGNVWFTETVARTAPNASVGVITPSGVVTEFPVANRFPVGITSGPDNRLWYTLSASDSRIGRIAATSSSGTQIEFGFREGSGPRYITTGPDGNLWFTESTANRIGRMDPQGNLLHEIVLPAGSQPEDITVGPDPGGSPSGAIWFTEFGGNRIGRIKITEPCCVLDEFAAGISPGAGLRGITAGPDGNLWFTEEAADAVARITPSGTVTEFPLPGSGSGGPLGITVGQDGQLWYVELQSGIIGRMGLDGTVTGEFQTTGSGIDITAGADGNLWAGNNEDPGTITRINTALDPPAFRNPGEIAIPASGTDGPANPYPSTIAVSGLQGTVTDVNVRITGLSHTHPEHLDAVLVGPQGQTATLISDVGSPKNGESPGATSAPANGTTLNFDQDAAFSIPEQLPLLSGVYRPTDTPPIERTLEFPAPAPAPPYGTTLDAFDGTNPNGTWRLFIVEDVQSPDQGRIFGGWGLDIATTGPPPSPPPALPANDISLGKASRNKEKGTAALPVGVPGPGELALAGEGLKAASATATGAGEVALSVKAAGKAKKQLRRKGKKTFEPSVTFTPTGGAANTESTTVKLVRK